MHKLREYWDADIGNAKRLLELLQDPCLAMALQIIRSEGRPNKRGMVAAEVLMEMNALENSRLFGFHEALDLIEDLTKPKAKRENVNLDPHMDHAVVALRQRGLEPPEESKK